MGHPSIHSASEVATSVFVSTAENLNPYPARFHSALAGGARYQAWRRTIGAHGGPWAIENSGIELPACGESMPWAVGLSGPAVRAEPCCAARTAATNGKQCATAARGRRQAGLTSAVSGRGTRMHAMVLVERTRAASRASTGPTDVVWQLEAAHLPTQMRRAGFGTGSSFVDTPTRCHLWRSNKPRWRAYSILIPVPEPGWRQQRGRQHFSPDLASAADESFLCRQQQRDDRKPRLVKIWLGTSQSEGPADQAGRGRRLTREVAELRQTTLASGNDSSGVFSLAFRDQTAWNCRRWKLSQGLMYTHGECGL